MNIHVHIERIVVDGLPVGFEGRAELRRSVESELGRMLASRGLAPGLLSGAALRSVSAPPVELEHGSSPSDLGSQIAGSIGSSIARSQVPGGAPGGGGETRHHRPGGPPAGLPSMRHAAAVRFR